MIWGQALCLPQSMGFDLIPVTGKTPIIGKAASLWLSPGRRGKVLSGIAQTAYLLLDTGELVWLASPESPLHRRCIRWPVRLPGLADGTTFLVQDRSIDFASGIKLDLYNSEIWEAPLVPIREVVAPARLPAKLFDMHETLLSTGISPWIW